MAITPEEFFVKGLMEHQPPSPPVFVPDLPQKPNNGSSEGQHHVPNTDMMLPYISRVLMEDDDDDQLIDHPALLQAQQPFVQILSATSFGSNTASDLLQDGGGDESASNLPLSKGTELMRAFLNGMEEANMLLPKDSNISRDEQQVDQMVRESIHHGGAKKRYNRDDHLEEEGKRASKAVSTTREPEEDNANDENVMLDELMLHGCEICMRDTEKLHVSMYNEVEKKSRKSCSKAAKANAVDIRALLISSAQEMAANNHVRARELLKKIKQHASATGDAAQRLAQYFTKALEARLVGTGSVLCQSLMEERPSTMEFLMACSLYSAACCFSRVAFYFSTVTVMQAMLGKSRLHIVDYGMPYGFQWACLLRLLASREGGPPEVKITAIGCSKHQTWPSASIEEIQYQLNRCAHEFRLPHFKFHAVMKEWVDVCSKDLNIDADEVLVVNDLFSFSTLMDESIYFDNPNPRDTVLDNVRKMKPDVFIQSILNRSYGSSFLPRFREALFFFMALFDILDATIPRQNQYRLVLEQVVFGTSVLNTIACEGLDLVERPEKYRQWQARNQRVGLRQLPLKPGIVEEVKDQVMKHHHKDFFINQDGQWLLQGWMGRVLFAHSTWVAENSSSR
ncbi:hypothetical protein BS78_05G236900 [Paspalum vaginatum]|nr:hypothetical protein BS78_05G236900 [Paspalum vaginatum]